RLLPHFKIEEDGDVRPLFLDRQTPSDDAAQRNLSNLMIQQIQEAVNKRAVLSDLTKKVDALKAEQSAKVPESDEASLSFNEVRKNLADQGITISSRDGEYRVNFREGSEDHAYYTGDLDD